MELPLSLSIVFVILLLVISALLSGVETALLASSPGKIHRLAKAGNIQAGLVKKLRLRMERVLGSLLLFNVLVNNLATSLSTELFIKYFGENGVFYATLLMTSLIVTYAEVLPKILAFSNPEGMSLFYARAIRIIVFIFSFVTYIMQIIAEKSLRLFGVKYDPQARHANSIEELRGAIDLHNLHDSESIEERAMLHSILDLGDVEVGEVMIHRRHMLTINADLPASKILEQVVASPFSRIPLWKETKDNIVGILHTKVLLRTLYNSTDKQQEMDLLSLTHKPWFIPESTTLQEQLTAFRQRKEHFALVVDEYGVIQGIVTLEDILEEIVGEISDETDVPLQGVWQARDSSIIALGTTTLRDLNRKFQWMLPDEEASTVAGLVLYESRIIPEIGQTFVIQGFRFKVLKRARNQLTLLRIFPPPNLTSDLV